MADDWSHRLQRWTEAGLIDPASAERIRQFEQSHHPVSPLAWPVRVALIFGGLMLGAGVLLFVAAQWDALSPAARFLLVLTLSGAFHIAAGAFATRFKSLATVLHALGTLALGAGIFLAAQIFNLEEHWPGGLLLWTLGAALGYALLRDEPQFAIVAMLTPAWLVSEWMVAATSNRTSVESGRVAALGLFLTALTYFTAPEGARIDRRRWVLLWIGGLALLPLCAVLVAVSQGMTSRAGVVENGLSVPLRILGWTGAMGIPGLAALAIRRRNAWPIGAAAVWVVLLFAASRISNLLQYPCWALFAIGLVSWGVREGRSERINVGAAIFAATVLAFYFSEVMDKLGRSASLIGFGLLFIAGGIWLERLRRRLVVQSRSPA